MSESALTKQELINALSKDGFRYEIIHECYSKPGAMNTIGSVYKKKQEYGKAMAWYRLTAAENNAMAQNNIGFMYHYGYGVPQDGFMAMEWHLKAAVQDLKIARENIGFSFESGKGVPVNKYKALEWYTKCVENPDDLKAVAEQGIEIEAKDKDKTISQLIIETEVIIQSKRKKKDAEIKALNQLKIKMEEESIAKDAKIKSLEEKLKNFHTNSKEEKIW